ncbi:MAG: hypothetical protein CMM94_04515 [Rickettsiales bacterium]|nr:hypothetical protein [Rickettsiales bacterium]
MADKTSEQQLRYSARRQPSRRMLRSAMRLRGAQGRRLSAVPRVRILPIAMMLMLIAFGLKVSDVVTGSRALSDAMLASSAIAEEEATTAEATEAGESGEGAASADDVDLASLDEEEQAPRDMRKEREGYSQVELDLLQSLGERRKELQERERGLEMREKLLDATEMRIDDKIKEMKTLQEQTQVLLKQYEKHEEAQVNSLVKIYENMKPKDAAAIFNEMDMPILLEVIDQMSERKVAPVLAGMSPQKARDVTEELAELRKIKPVSAGDN